MKVSISNPEAVVRRMYYLAYEASHTHGMGLMREKNGQIEEDVWNNICNAGDYDGSQFMKPRRHNGVTQMRGDYVFGRMMKLCISYSKDSITIPDGEPRQDYQSWCSQYLTYKDLLDAAVASLEVDVTF